MTRTVTIGNKTITIESGYTPTARPARGKSPFRQAVEALEPGESFVVPLDGKAMKLKSVTLRQAGKKLGRTFRYRKTDGGYRIYRTDSVPTQNTARTPETAPKTRKGSLLSLASGW